MMRPRWLGQLAAPVLSWPVVASARTRGEKGRRRGREGERGWQRHGSGPRAALTASQPTPGLHRFEHRWHLSHAAPKWPSGPSPTATQPCPCRDTVPPRRGGSGCGGPGVASRGSAGDLSAEEERRWGEGGGRDAG
jgi:hypothetical protein